MQRTLESRTFISAILAMAIGVILFYAHPFPAEQIFQRVIALRAQPAFLSFKYPYYTLLFTTACKTTLDQGLLYQGIRAGSFARHEEPRSVFGHAERLFSNCSASELSNCGKLSEARCGEVAERLNAAVC